MTSSQQPGTKHSEDPAWISSQLFQIRAQIATLAENMESLQRTQIQVQRQIRILEIRLKARPKRERESHKQVPDAITVSSCDSMGKHG